MNQIDSWIEEIKTGRAKIIEGPVTDQIWTVTFKDGLFIKRGVYIYEEYENEITESEARSLLETLGERVLNKLKQN